MMDDSPRVEPEGSKTGENNSTRSGTLAALRVLKKLLKYDAAQRKSDPAIDNLLPERWRQMGTEDRLELCKALLAAVLKACDEHRKSLIVVVEPEMAPVLIDAVRALVPPALLRDATFSTDEEEFDRKLPVKFAFTGPASTSEFTPETKRRNLICNTFDPSQKWSNDYGKFIFTRLSASTTMVYSLVMAFEGELASRRVRRVTSDDLRLFMPDEANFSAIINVKKEITEANRHSVAGNQYIAERLRWFVSEGPGRQKFVKRLVSEDAEHRCLLVHQLLATAERYGRDLEVTRFLDELLPQLPSERVEQILSLNNLSDQYRSMVIRAEYLEKGRLSLILGPAWCQEALVSENSALEIAIGGLDCAFEIFSRSFFKGHQEINNLHAVLTCLIRLKRPADELIQVFGCLQAEQQEAFIELVRTASQDALSLPLEFQQHVFTELSKVFEGDFFAAPEEIRELLRRAEGVPLVGEAKETRTLATVLVQRLERLIDNPADPERVHSVLQQLKSIFYPQDDGDPASQQIQAQKAITCLQQLCPDDSLSDLFRLVEGHRKFDLELSKYFHSPLSVTVGTEDSNKKKGKSRSHTGPAHGAESSKISGSEAVAGAETVDRPKNSRRAKSILAAAVLAVLILGGGFGVYFSDTTARRDDDLTTTSAQTDANDSEQPELPAPAAGPENEPFRGTNPGDTNYAVNRQPGVEPDSSLSSPMERTMLHLVLAGNDLTDATTQAGLILFPKTDLENRQLDGLEFKVLNYGPETVQVIEDEVFFRAAEAEGNQQEPIRLLQIVDQADQVYLRLENLSDRPELQVLTRDLLIQINDTDVLLVGCTSLNRSRSLRFSRETGTHTFRPIDGSELSESTKRVYRRLLGNIAPALWLDQERKINLVKSEEENVFGFGNTTGKVMFNNQGLQFTFIDGLPACKKWDQVHPIWRPPAAPPLKPLPNGRKENPVQRSARQRKLMEDHLQSKTYLNYVKLHQSRITEAVATSGLTGLNPSWIDDVPREIKTVDLWVERYRSLIQDEYRIATIPKSFEIELESEVLLRFTK